MRLKWWQHGIHLEPESQEDYDKLKVIYEMLEGLKLGWADSFDEIKLGDVSKVETDNEESVTMVHDAPKVVS